MTFSEFLQTCDLAELRMDGLGGTYTVYWWEYADDKTWRIYLPSSGFTPGKLVYASSDETQVVEFLLSKRRPERG